MDKSKITAPSSEVEQTELEELVPARSRARTIIIIAICVLALVGAWFLPPLLNPTLATGGGDAVGSLIEGNPVVLTGSGFPDDQQRVTVLGVDDLDGARVIGAWVTHNQQDWDAFFDAWDTVHDLLCKGSGCPVSDGAVPPSDDAGLVKALADAGAPMARIDLPQKIGPDEWLWVMWEITDCTVASPDGDPDAQVTLQLRGPFGLPVERQGRPDSNPFAHGTDDFEESGVCPS